MRSSPATRRTIRPAAVSRRDRDAVRQGAARLCNGSRHSDRAVLAEMLQSDPPVRYLVGTPKGRLTRLEKLLVDQPWQQARQGVQVKLLAQDGEFYVFAESADRVFKERAMRRRQLKWLWRRLHELAAMKSTREQLLMKLGAARAKAPVGWRLIDLKVEH